MVKSDTPELSISFNEFVIDTEPTPAVTELPPIISTDKSPSFNPKQVGSEELLRFNINSFFENVSFFHIYLHMQNFCFCWFSGSHRLGLIL